MIRVCCVCRKKYGEKEPLEDKRETHGYCDECLPQILNKQVGTKKDRAALPTQKDSTEDE